MVRILMPNDPIAPILAFRALIATELMHIPFTDHVYLAVGLYNPCDRFSNPEIIPRGAYDMGEVTHPNTVKTPRETPEKATTCP